MDSRPTSALDRGLRALADPTRLRIVAALRERERCVRDLCDALYLGQPLVSHHVGQLVTAGLVTGRRAKGYTLYRIDPAGATALRGELDLLLDADALVGAARRGGGEQCCR